MQFGACVLGGSPKTPRTSHLRRQFSLVSIKTEEDLSLTASHRCQPSSLRLKTPSCCDWWEVHRVCNKYLWENISLVKQNMSHWSEAKGFLSGCWLVQNPSPYFPVNRWQPAGRDGLKPTRDVWKKLLHANSHQTEINIIFRTGSFRGDGSCLNDLSPSHTTLL